MVNEQVKKPPDEIRVMCETWKTWGWMIAHHTLFDAKHGPKTINSHMMLIGGDGLLLTRLLACDVIHVPYMTQEVLIFLFRLQRLH